MKEKAKEFKENLKEYKRYQGNSIELKIIIVNSTAYFDEFKRIKENSSVLNVIKNNSRKMRKIQENEKQFKDIQKNSSKTIREFKFFVLFLGVGNVKMVYVGVFRICVTYITNIFVQNLPAFTKNEISSWNFRNLNKRH